jgi:anion-transporting  ArsA/GET3 family ATPase
MAPPRSEIENLKQALSRRLIFVSGKGGAGKTCVSQAIARALSRTPAGRRSAKKRVLWVTFEDPFRPAGELKEITPQLSELNCEAQTAFEEYATMKIGIPALTRVLVQNSLVRYMAKAAPGIHELVLLGKVWYERNHWDHVVCDMPSTGYGLAMFQSTSNFADLFRGGPIHHDAEAMLDTFRDPKECSQIIVSLPEEMPLRESLELRDFLIRLFPRNQPALLVNRRFPHPPFDSPGPTTEEDLSPLARSPEEYAVRRAHLEALNLKIWTDLDLSFNELEYIPPSAEAPTLDRIPESIVETLAEELKRLEVVPS